MSKDAAAAINACLSERLAQERERRGVSKRSLAGLADIDRATVKVIEKPDENTTILNVIRYGLALKLDVGEILSECLQPYLAQETTKPKPKPKKK